MQNGTTGIFGLQTVLEFQSLKYIVRVTHRKLAGVGVVRRRPFSKIIFIGADDFRKLLFIQQAKAI